jgi:hypothetical protein
MSHLTVPHPSNRVIQLAHGLYMGASKNPKARNLLYGIECDSEKLRDFIGTRHEAARFFRFFRAAEEAAEDAGFS